MKNECDAEPDRDGKKVAAAWHGDDAPDREDGDRTERATTGGTGNVLRLGPGITAADLKLGLGSLALRVGADANDVIHFESFNPANVLATRPFDTIEFEDGGGLTYADLLARGFDIDGTESNDTLRGLAGSDTLDGRARYDTLTGGDERPANQARWRLCA